MSMIVFLVPVTDAEIDAFRAEPETVYATFEDEERPSFDLEKSWHGLHYLLTGTAWEGTMPTGFLLIGGESIGDEDAGDYGPPRALRSDEVRAVAEALRGIDEATLRSRFDPAAMMKLEIYPPIWDRDPAVDDGLGWTLEYYGPLKEFIETAVTNHHGLIIGMG